MAYLNDLHSYDLDSRSWQLMPVKGQVPSGREGHSAVVYGSTMIVVGGHTKSMPLPAPVTSTAARNRHRNGTVFC